MQGSGQADRQGEGDQPQQHSHRRAADHFGAFDDDRTIGAAQPGSAEHQNNPDEVTGGGQRHHGGQARLPVLRAWPARPDRIDEDLVEGIDHHTGLGLHAGHHSNSPMSLVTSRPPVIGTAQVLEAVRSICQEPSSSPEVLSRVVVWRPMLRIWPSAT